MHNKNLFYDQLPEDIQESIHKINMIDKVKKIYIPWEISKDTYYNKQSKLDTSSKLWVNYSIINKGKISTKLRKYNKNTNKISNLHESIEKLEHTLNQSNKNRDMTYDIYKWNDQEKTEY